MVDVFTKEKRSEVMAKIRGRGNRSTEWRLRSRLIAFGIRGWRLHAKDVIGKPDFVFDDFKLVIFVDGCFWHGCRKCRSIPTTNTEFWLKKIKLNQQRDKKTNCKLRNSGWVVIRLWEHQLNREPNACLFVVKNALAEAIRVQG